MQILCILVFTNQKENNRTKLYSTSHFSEIEIISNKYIRHSSTGNSNIIYSIMFIKYVHYP